MSTYTTKQGDMWDLIAYQKLGSTDYTDALINANKTYRDYYVFPAGIVLTLPEITESADTTTLPPWKRVTS